MSITRTKIQNKSSVRVHSETNQDNNRFWPDPDSSRGVELEPVSTPILKSLHRYGVFRLRCWAASVCGEPYRLYEELRDWLEQTINHHPMLKDRPFAKGLTCCMIGRFEHQIVPAIVLHCKNRKYREDACSCIAAEEVWINFRRQNPLFTLLTHCRAPQPIAALPPHIAGTSIYRTYDDPNLFASKIAFSNEDSHTAIEHGAATLGGIVLLDNKPYGLTVAHVFQKNSHQHAMPLNTTRDAREDVSSSSCSVDDAEFFARFGQTGCNDLPSTMCVFDEYIDFSGSECSEDGESSLTAEAVEAPATPDSEIQLKDRIGALYAISGSDSSIGFDWALCELQEGENNIVQNYFRMLDHHQSPQIFPETIANIDSGFDDVRAYVATASKGMIECHLCATPYRYQVYGQAQFTTVFPLRLKQNLALGDCGSWVITDQCKWMGHIVAQQPETNLAYMISSADIRLDINRQLKISFRLPTKRPSSDVAVDNPNIGSLATKSMSLEEDRESSISNYLTKHGVSYTGSIINKLQTLANLIRALSYRCSQLSTGLKSMSSDLNALRDSLEEVEEMSSKEIERLGTRLAVEQLLEDCISSMTELENLFQQGFSDNQRKRKWTQRHLEDDGLQDPKAQLLHEALQGHGRTILKRLTSIRYKHLNEAWLPQSHPEVHRYVSPKKSENKADQDKGTVTFQPPSFIRHASSTMSKKSSGDVAQSLASFSSGNSSKCKRCRVHKIKCDQQSPSCQSCERAGAVCTGRDQWQNRTVSENDLNFITSRLNYLEDMLTMNGIDFIPAEEFKTLLATNDEAEKKPLDIEHSFLSQKASISSSRSNKATKNSLVTSWMWDTSSLQERSAHTSDRPLVSNRYLDGPDPDLLSRIKTEENPDMPM